MVSTRIDQSTESVYQNMNFTKPLHAVHEVNCPFVSVITKDVILIGVDLIS